MLNIQEKILLRSFLWKITLSLFLFFLLPSLSFGDCQSVRRNWSYWYTNNCPLNGPDRLNFSCPSGYGYRTSPIFVGCRTSGTYTDEIYEVECCRSQAEADSVICVNSGKQWVSGQCQEPPPPCDNTYTCTTSQEMAQEETTSDNIVCVGDVCYGEPSCAYFTRFTTTCRNECGDVTTQSYESVKTYVNGQCGDMPDEPYQECGSNKCYDMDNGHYVIYQVCQTSDIKVEGSNDLQRGAIPKVVQGGQGRCSQMGMKSEDPAKYASSSSSGGEGGGGSSSSSSGGVDWQCLIFKICSSSSGAGEYDDPMNRTPENGCYCTGEDMIISNQKRIVCPDGSTSYFVGSCDDWRNAPRSSSSSAPQPPQSSESGGGGDSLTIPYGNWATWEQVDYTNWLLRTQKDFIEQFGGTVTGQLAQANQALTGIKSSVDALGGNLRGGPVATQDISGTLGELDNIEAWARSVNVGDWQSQLGTLPTDVNGVGTAISNEVKGIASGVGKDYADNVQSLANKLDYSKLKGDGGCPTSLNRTYTVKIGNSSFAFGPIGKYFCQPILGNVSPWNIGVAALRFVVAFICFMYLFRVVSSGGKDDD